VWDVSECLAGIAKYFSGQSSFSDAQLISGQPGSLLTFLEEIGKIVEGIPPVVYHQCQEYI
jgi:hypothetical protein